MQSLSTPVLIVGAGPVGLQLALDLGWRGDSCMIIDQGFGDIVHPRAAGIAPRTMEFLRRWGIADEIPNAGFPQDFPPNIVYCTSLDGHLIGLQEYPSMRDRKPLETTPQTRERCPQIWFDPILARALGKYPQVDFRRPYRFESFRDRGEDVVSTVVDVETGETLDVTSQYLIACDGVTSGIRRALGIKSANARVLSYSVNAVLNLPQFLSRHGKGPAERYLFVDQGGTWANLTVIDGRDRWRFTLTGSERQLDLKTLDLDAAIRRALGPDVPFEIMAIAPWRRTEAIADTFKVGRVILCGDAAHVMSPTGGFGMNTGAGDAVDLGWKLDAVLRGWGGAHLLDSYEVERRPVAVRNAKASSRNYHIWAASDTYYSDVMDPTEVGTAARARIGEFMMSTLQEEWELLGIQLGYRYEGSPVVVPDGTPQTTDDARHYIQTGRPGARAPHAWLADGRSTIDLFGKGFVLLRLCAPDIDVSAFEAAAATRCVPFSVVDVDDRNVATLYERKLVLVRPDGHTAWRADGMPPDADAIIETVRGARAGEAARGDIQPAAAAAG